MYDHASSRSMDGCFLFLWLWALCPALVQWIQLLWNFTQGFSRIAEVQSIMWMELLPIVLASTAWGPALKGQRVTVHCDNMGAVALVNSGYSRVPKIMHLLQCLFFSKVYYQFVVQVAHIEGAYNTSADAISQNNLEFLQSQGFLSTYRLKLFGEDLVTLLVVEQPD